MKLGIGIDTGGTYTDAVIYDFDAKIILGTAKSLTTKNDLSIGILSALDKLPSDLTIQADLVSLSTTLATNACVEDKIGNAKLVFFGGDAKIIDELGGKYGLPSSEDVYIQDNFTKFSGEMEREPDWKLFESEIKHGYDDYDGIGIIEINAMRNGAQNEKKAKRIFENKYDTPVVCGHELSSKLNSLQRGASTLLNAGLFSIIREFLSAIKNSMAMRKIGGTLVIVRSDGSLMSKKFASTRPVETLLSGPAASTIGGSHLIDNPNNIIIDMGGTTTDITLVNKDIPVLEDDGIAIGRWKTFVNGLYVKTFGLGGDSAIHYNEKGIYLENYRVIPLCIAAQEYPIITDNIQKLLKQKHSYFLYEHYILIKDISHNSKYSEEEKEICEILKDKPLTITEAAEAVGKDIYSLNLQRLLQDDVIQICGLTPTDIMHIKGDFTNYCSKASLLATQFAADNLDISVEVFCNKVYDEVKRKLYLNIVKVLLENKYPEYKQKGIHNSLEEFIHKSYEDAKSGNQNKLLTNFFHTKFLLIGIGAPIHIFLPDIAKMLKTQAVTPKYHEVANALGAIVSSISATRSIEIKPNNNFEGTVNYTVYGNIEPKTIEKMDDAIGFALAEAKDAAIAEATKRGAKGDLTFTSEIKKKEGTARDSIIYLGTTVTVHATGAIGF